MLEYPTSRDNFLSNFCSIMASVVFRFDMAFYGVVLVMLVLCNSDTVTGSLPTTKNVTKTTQPSPSNVSSTTLPSTSKPTGTTSAKPKSTSSPTISTKSPTTNHSTAAPTASTNGTKSTPASNGSTTATPTVHGNHSTTLSPTKLIPTPTPEGHGTDRGKWVATGFAVFFLITTIVMTVLYCRQRKIYRELEGDSSLSRLI